MEQPVVVDLSLFAVVTLDPDVLVFGFEEGLKAF